MYSECSYFYILLLPALVLNIIIIYMSTYMMCTIIISTLPYH